MTSPGKTSIIKEPIQATWTDSDVATVKDQIAREATAAEFKLFLYTARTRGLNPLLKQIYCIHRAGRMSIQTSIEGYRLIANRTGKLAGIERGVTYNDTGELTHGWARVWRSDWQHPVYEEVPFNEYKQKSDNWLYKKETMIKKCAEAAALRIAFPEDLSGLYTTDEMNNTVEVTSIIEEKPVELNELSMVFDSIVDLMEANALTQQQAQKITGISLDGVSNIEIARNALQALQAYIRDAAHEERVNAQ